MKKTNLTFLLLLILSVMSQSARADYPIASHRFLADPGSLVYNGRVYLYCSNDDENAADDKGSYMMKSIVCISSNDLKNWTDHGIVFEVPRDATWAGRSWAPSTVERDGKFFLYFGNGGNGIGVATANNPLGPFKDPLGKELIKNSTPGVMPARNMWLFDPMAFIDDDGQAYLYFGGNGDNNVRCIKLNRDMISVDTPAIKLNAKNFFEASWMHKNNGVYYFSYSANPSADMRIDYMKSTSPTYGFTYGGTVSRQPPMNDNNNNHQAIFKFNGEWYQAYHNRFVAKNANIPSIYKRNLCLDMFKHNSDGSIEVMTNTENGLKQLRSVNPLERNEAECFNAQFGIKTEICKDGGMDVCDINNGDWIKITGVKFNNEISKFNARVAGTYKFTIEIRQGSKTGPLLGTCRFPSSADSQDWKIVSCKLKPISGIYDLCLVFVGETNTKLSFDWWQAS
jgi:arabinoxylan arabinofuranohydrolase